jgi:hypothetical protein
MAGRGFFAAMDGLDEVFLKVRALQQGEQVFFGKPGIFQQGLQNGLRRVANPVKKLLAVGGQGLLQAPGQVRGKLDGRLRIGHGNIMRWPKRSVNGASPDYYSLENPRLCRRTPKG